MSRSLVTILLGLSFLGAMPSKGAAQDACGSGASELSDRRGLAALHRAVEAGCSCEAYDGSAGRGRSAFLACARQVVEESVRTAQLRGQCRLAADTFLAGTTCGTSGVACGRSPSDLGQVPSCRVQSRTSCEAGVGNDVQVCSGATSCSEVTAWSAGTCLDPRAYGPFEAGYRILRLVKKSVVDPSQDRVLETVVWYPTNAGAGPVDATFDAVKDAPVDAAAGPYPVLLFSHGSCGYPHQSTFLTARLASQGFVVVSPPHPGNLINNGAGCRSSQALAASFQERPQDITFVLDEMLARNRDVSTPFFNALDPERIGMSGHSFGGLTTYLVDAIESRIIAALPMAPATNALAQLRVPSMTLLGSIDSVVSNPGIRAAYERSVDPKYLVDIERAGHYAFSDLCSPGSRDCASEVNLEQAEAHDLVIRYAVPFLQVYLAGNKAWEPLLVAPAIQGAVKRSSFSDAEPPAPKPFRKRKVPRVR